jgi:hypothetical protein
MPTAGTISDIKAAPALLQRAERMRYLLADEGYDAAQLRARCGTKVLFRHTPLHPPAHHPVWQGSLAPPPCRDFLLPSG